jgi:NADPH:quinone reductase-like Zn-dependent oxidoreductase
MKAMIIRKYGVIDDIEQAEIHRPTAGNGQVLVKVKAAAVNPADLKVVTGKNGGKFLHSGKSPIRLGFDFSGVAEEVAEEVPGFAPGDEVFGFLPYSSKTAQGSFAEYVVVNSDTIAKKAASISHTEAAAAATTASTALQALAGLGGIQKGQNVLVNGASGGVGGFGVQIARHFGAEVWGTCSAGNIDFVKSLGAGHAIDYKKNSLKDLTGPFDIILDAVSNSSYGECSGIMAPKGVYITMLPSLGLLTGKIRGLFSSRKCSMCIVKAKTTDLSELAGMMEAKSISSSLAAVYPLEKLKEALEKFSAGGIRGKIAITVDED